MGSACFLIIRARRHQCASIPLGIKLRQEVLGHRQQRDPFGCCHFWHRVPKKNTRREFLAGTAAVFALARDVACSASAAHSHLNRLSLSQQRARAAHLCAHDGRSLTIASFRLCELTLIHASRITRPSHLPLQDIFSSPRMPRRSAPRCATRGGMPITRFLVRSWVPRHQPQADLGAPAAAISAACRKWQDDLHAAGRACAARAGHS